MVYIRAILPSLLKLIDYNDKQIRAESFEALSFIADGPNERIQMIIEVKIKIQLISSKMIFINLK